MLSREGGKKAAQLEIADEGAVAMEQDNRVTRAVLDVVQANAVDIYEAAAGWVLCFRSSRTHVHQESGGPEGKSACARKEKSAAGLCRRSVEKTNAPGPLMYAGHMTS
jgi:hypothetical protein